LEGGALGKEKDRTEPVKVEGLGQLINGDKGRDTSYKTGKINLLFHNVPRNHLNVNTNSTSTDWGILLPLKR
jgi:hypothetical protein